MARSGASSPAPTLGRAVSSSRTACSELPEHPPTIYGHLGPISPGMAQATRRLSSCIGMEPNGLLCPVQIRPTACSLPTCSLPEWCRHPGTFGSSAGKTFHHTRKPWRFTAQGGCRLTTQRPGRTARFCIQHGTSGSRNTLLSCSAVVRPSGSSPRLYSAIRFFHLRKSVMLCGSMRTSTRYRLASSRFIS
jgi:hypothetical protein